MVVSSVLKMSILFGCSVFDVVKKFCVMGLYIVW